MRRHPRTRGEWGWIYLLWYEGDEKFVEIPWEHGFMYTPPFGCFTNILIQAQALRVTWHVVWEVADTPLFH